MTGSMPTGHGESTSPTARPWRQRAREAALGGVLVAPVVVLVAVFFIYPIGKVMSKSFTDPYLGLQNYDALIYSEAFRNIMRNTFQIALWTTAVALVISYPFAYALAHLPPRTGRFLLVLSLVPFWTAIIARLYAWTIILGRRGIISTYLMRLDLIHDPLNLLHTRQAVIIGMVHVMVPYMVIILYSVMIGIDRSIIDAAKSLGANFSQIFLRVYLPLTLRGVYAASVLVFILSLGYFITPATLGGGGDVTIATYVQQEVSILQWGGATAMCAVLLIVTVSLFVVFNRLYGAERLVTGGIRK